MVASLSPPTPYTALMSLLSVALSSVTVKSSLMIPSRACRVNIQPARKPCSITAESLRNLGGIDAQTRRFWRSISTAYADDEQEAIAERDRISEGRIKDDSIFEPYYSEMEQMIHDEMKAHGIEYFYEDEDENEEGDEE